MMITILNFNRSRQTALPSPPRLLSPRKLIYIRDSNYKLKQDQPPRPKKGLLKKLSSYLTALTQSRIHPPNIQNR